MSLDGAVLKKCWVSAPNVRFIYLYRNQTKNLHVSSHTKTFKMKSKKYYNTQWNQDGKYLQLDSVLVKFPLLILGLLIHLKQELCLDNTNKLSDSKHKLLLLSFQPQFKPTLLTF